MSNEELEIEDRICVKMDVAHHEFCFLQSCKARGTMISIVPYRLFDDLSNNFK